MKCKTCGAVLLSLQEHADHFELKHRVSSRSLFTCGIADCVVKLKNHESYQQHINDFHERIDNSPSSNDDLMHKCPFPGCNFKSKSKGNIRSHKFWHKTPTEKPVVLEVSSKPNENLFDFENIPFQAVSSLPQIGNVCDSICEAEDSVKKSEDAEGCISKKLTHMCICLNTKHHVPDSTVEYVLGTYSSLLKESSAVTTARVLKELNSSSQIVSNENILTILSKDPLLELHGPRGPLRSYHCRKKQYDMEFPLIKPRSVALGLNDQNVACKYHYIPIKETLQSLFKDDSVYEQYLENSRASVLVPPEDLTDITSGSVFFENELFADHPDAIQIVLFQDDIELCKALGAAAGSFKMMHMGFTLGNLHPWNRSKVDPLQLLLLCKEKDVAYFGFPKVLNEVLEDIIDLETNGIEIRGKTVKASVLVLLGDNLGTHSIGGFMESFSKTIFFCRYCEEPRSEWNARWNVSAGSEDEAESSSDSSESDSDSSDSGNEANTATAEDYDSEDDIPLSQLISSDERSEVIRRSQRVVPWRTVESYKSCVKQLKKRPEGVKGVVADCELNKLKFFHVVGQSPPCYHHDVAEGFARHDVLLCLRLLGQKYNFDMTKVDRLFAAFDFKGTDKLDKPPKNQSKKTDKIRGNAVQVLTYIRFLPLIIGHMITNKTDPAWVMILSLNEILQLVSSPVVARSCMEYIDQQIIKYLMLRTSLFPNVPLRPKHHFFEHYKYLLLRYGPLSRSSTLRFESKHRFFRSEFCNKKCLKNPTKTISTSHQQMQSALRVESLFAQHPTMGEATPLSDLGVESDIKQCLFSSFGQPVASNLLYSHEITFHNTLYEKGSVLVVSTEKHPELECMKVALLVTDGKFAYAIVTFEYPSDSDVDDPEETVLEFVAQFCKNVKKQSLQSKLTELGVETISDLEHINLDESFGGLLKPVEIGKLKKGFSEINKISENDGGIMFDLKEIFGGNQKDLLKNATAKLSHAEVIDLTRSLGDHIYNNSEGPVKMRTCTRLAQRFFNTYKHCLEGTASKGLEVSTLATQIKDRVRYCQRLNRKRSATVPLLRDFSKRQCHGLHVERDVPSDFPNEETSETQEEKRLELIKMHSTGEIDKKKMKTLMAQTYVAQRLTINTLPNMEKVLIDWPFIGKFRILRDHFSVLMDADMEKINSQIEELFPKVIKFLTAEADKENKKSTKEITKNLRNIMKKYEACEDKCDDIIFITVFLGLAAKLDIDLAFMIRYFDETTSFDEVEASGNLPASGKPTLAVLGNDLFDLPKIFVLVDNRVISTDPVKPMNAIKLAFMCYFVFKIEYPKQAHPLFNFLERNVFLIEAPEGACGRIERSKKPNGVWESAPKALAPKYISFMHFFDDFITRWDL